MYTVMPRKSVKFAIELMIHGPCIYCRYAFTVVACVTVYIVAWLLLDTTDVTEGQSKSHLSPDDAPQFRVNLYIFC